MECDLEDIETPYLRRLFAYWQDKRRGQDFPSRRDLDPREFAFALGHVLLIDVLERPQRFRFRLHGSVLSFRARYDMTGRMVDELPDEENRAVLLQRCRDLVRTRRPCFARSQRTVDGTAYGYEVVWLPLSSDGEQIDMLLGGLAYFDDPMRMARTTPHAAAGKERVPLPA
ncbi:PAS domain-containing protein [Desertibaculum subflavum]|uniref:PAS domain-containing protein n=1 Tax=Desertibaculum subflavum TaxID=2268458 RepID=UPI0013C40335